MANSRECRANFCEPDIAYRDGTGWLGRQDSNLRMSRFVHDGLATLHGRRSTRLVHPHAVCDGGNPHNEARSMSRFPAS